MATKGQARWACRRGMKELDLLLEALVEDFFDSFSPDQQEHLLQFLKEEDQDLLEWSLGLSDPPAKPSYYAIVKQLKSLRLSFVL